MGPRSRSEEAGPEALSVGETCGTIIMMSVPVEEAESHDGATDVMVRTIGRRSSCVVALSESVESRSPSCDGADAGASWR